MDISVEIEALTYTYEDLRIHADGVMQLPLQPYTAEDDNLQFVQATLCLTIGPAYPDTLPGITLIDAKGLSDSALSSIVKAVESEAESLRGDLMLLALFQRCQDELTTRNMPEGGHPCSHQCRKIA